MRPSLSQPTNMNRYRQPKTADYSVAISDGLTKRSFYQTNLSSSQRSDSTKETIPVPPNDSLGILLKHTGLKHLRLYRLYKLVYLYLPTYQCYFKLSPDELGVIVSRIFSSLDLPRSFRTHTYLDNVVKCAFVDSDVSYLGHPKEDIAHHLVSVANGVLDLQTGTLLGDPSPNLFVVTYLPYNYEPGAPTPCFSSYLEHISEGVDAKRRFLRSVLNLVVRGHPGLQLFVFLYGPGGTGKTTFTLLANALVGDATTHATTLRALNTDQFEAVNVADKKLILIGDTENYTKDISQLKALTGGDPIRGRMMYSNFTREVYLQGAVLMSGNSLLNIRDPSGAIMRRIRPYKMAKAPVEREHLLSKDAQGGWSGKLASELPGILPYVLSTPQDDVDTYVKGFHNIKALREGLEETADILNPLRVFVQEALEEGEGASLGLKPKGEKQSRDFASRHMLYDTYLDFCYKRGLPSNVSHKTFAANLISACEELGMKVRRVKKPAGTYMEGVVVSPLYWNPDVSAGGPLDPQLIDRTPEIAQSHYPLPERVVRQDQPSATQEVVATPQEVVATPQEVVEREDEALPLPKALDSPLSHRIVATKGERNKLDRPSTQYNSSSRTKALYFSTYKPEHVHPALAPSLIDDYHRALSNHTAMRAHANKVVMGLDKERVVEAIMADYSPDPEPTPAFLEGVRKQVVDGVEKLKAYGAIPRTYKQMGISPRLFPTRYGASINSTKKLVRRYGYRLAAGVFAEYGCSLLDVDLRSAYVSVLLGLYPDELQRLHVILSKSTVWDSIRSDYEREGRFHIYDKPSVKVCVYASLFGGGKSAMFASILESHQKRSGMSLNEFKADEMYERVYQLATVTTGFMVRHPIVRDFQDLSTMLVRAYESHWLQGPTGHSYLIEKHCFRNVFPCFLRAMSLH